MAMTMNDRKKKEQLREILIKRREAIPRDAFLQKSEQIITALKALPQFEQSGIVHCYVSMNQRQEVNTHPLIREMLVLGKQVVVPVTEFESGTMRHIAIQRFDQLKENKWGVLEPDGGEEVAVSALDLIIVPMVGGDRHKNRIGYGKGFYDRFLAGVNGHTVGLLYNECLLEEIPVEPFDIALDLMVTEQEIIR